MILSLIICSYFSIYVASFLKFKYNANKPLDFCLVFSLIVPVFMIFIMIELLSYSCIKEKMNYFKAGITICKDLPFIHSLAIFIISHSEEGKDNFKDSEEKFMEYAFKKIYDGTFYK